MAEAVATATIGADLATEADIAQVRADLVPLASKLDLANAKVALVKMLVVAIGIMLTGVGVATTIILSRLPAATVPAAPPPQHAIWLPPIAR